MNDRDEDVRALIAGQAADWFIAQREGNMGARERAAFDAWLLASPVHVDEYLGVTAIALALPTAAGAPEWSIDALLERARAANDAEVRPLRAEVAQLRAVRARPSPWHRMQYAAALACIAMICGLYWWNATRISPQQFATSRGEQRSWLLADHSVLRLNTDSAVTVRFGQEERLVELQRGQAFFEVAHEPDRRFRVDSGTTHIVAVGTRFDVHRDDGRTVVTVAEGRVLVSSGDGTPRQVPVSGGQQINVVDGALPDHATPVDTQRCLAWLHHQVSFDQEPLATVVAEFNRYGAVPIEIESPSLQGLQVSGVFAIGDTDTFVAFLRTLDDVTVEVSPARIRVSRRDNTR